MTNPEKVANGINAIGEWWASGVPPVSVVQATARANVCEACPLNKHEGLFESATEFATKIVRSGLEWKHNLSLHVPNEDKLMICSACGCDLKLKVFAPLRIATQAFTTLKEFDALDSECWIRKESR